MMEYPSACIIGMHRAIIAQGFRAPRSSSQVVALRSASMSDLNESTEEDITRAFSRLLATKEKDLSQLKNQLNLCAVPAISKSAPNNNDVLRSKTRKVMH